MDKTYLKQRISKYPLEYLLVGAIFLILGGVGSLYIGGATSWDALLYMNLSLNPAPEPYILNRYFHIYLQKIFFELSGHPLLGAKIFWSFLIALTGFLVYFNARTFTKNSNYLNGTIAILVFFSQPLIFKSAGVTFADFTVMMMVTLGVTIYLFYHRSNRYRRWLLVTLGLVFFFALKSKETGICLGVLFLGLSFGEGKSFHWPSFVKNMALIAVGIGVGVGFFMVLDQIFLGDALFGLRPSHFAELFTFNLPEEWTRRENSWYSYILASELLFPFTLYLVSFSRYPSTESKIADYVVWFLPLTIILFLTVSMIKGAWGVIPHYFVPAVPIISILAAQFFYIKPRVWFGLSVLGALLIFWLLNSYFYQYAAGSGWEKGDFLKAVIYPIALSILLLLIISVRKWNFVAITFSLSCLFLITFYPMVTIFTDLNARETVAGNSRKFYPFSQFSEYINSTEDMKIFISANIYPDHRMLCKKGKPVNHSAERRCSWMFNVFFSQNAKFDQFTVSATVEDMFKEDYTYIFLTNAEWETIQYSDDYDRYDQIIRAAIKEGKYIVEIDPARKIAFIRKGDRSSQ